MTKIFNYFNLMFIVHNYIQHIISSIYYINKQNFSSLDCSFYINFQTFEIFNYDQFSMIKRYIKVYYHKNNTTSNGTTSEASNGTNSGVNNRASNGVNNRAKSKASKHKKIIRPNNHLS